MRSSLADSLRSLPPVRQRELIQTLSEEEAALLLYDWDGLWARDAQRLPDGDWIGWLLLAGRGYGKTRVGAETVRRWARDHDRVNLIGLTPADVRDVMILGDSGILACCPPAERPVYRPSLRRLDWPNGGTSLIFSAENPEALRGPQHEKLWADEIAAWAYPQETWDMAMLGLRLGRLPQWVATTTPKPISLVRSLVDSQDVVVTKGTTYENLHNLGAAFRQIIQRYEGTRLGRQELDAELLLDEGLAYRFSERLHVVAPFPVPDEWDRFEHMDYGLSAPTAWYVTAIDTEGNLIVCDGVYRPGLPSELAPEILQRRAMGWEAVRGGRRERNRAHADPAVFAPGSLTKWGRQAAVADEFRDVGVLLLSANNDRRAGFVRISELLRSNEGRRFPMWHPRAGEPGAPSLFIMDVPGTLDLREQLADAPLEEEGKPLPGEAIDRDWERSRGHAHAALRYGVMSRPGASEEPEQPLEDPRAELMRQHERRVEEMGRRPDKRRFLRV